MTSEQVLQAVRAYLGTVCGLTTAQTREQVRPEDADGARKVGVSYLTVGVTTDGPQGLPDIVDGEVAGSYVEQTRERRELRVSISGYGDAAEAWVQTAAGRWRERSGAALALRTAGVHPVRVTPIQKLTAVRDTASEPRWHFDFVVYAGREHAVSGVIDTAAHVVVDVSVSREDGVSLTAHAEVDTP